MSFSLKIMGSSLKKFYVVCIYPYFCKRKQFKIHNSKFYEKNNKVHHVHSSYDYDDYDYCLFK